MKKKNETAVLNEEKTSNNFLGTLIAAIVLFGVILICIFVFEDGIRASASAMTDYYNAAYMPEKKAAYDKLYDSAYNRAEKNYHLKNVAEIDIGNVKETSKLEVITVNDVEFVTENKDADSSNVTSWIEVTGEGTFTVNLKSAEYLVDNERHSVLVRIPHPELENVRITNTVRRWFADDFWRDGDFSEGIDLAISQRKEAGLRIQKSLMSNQSIYNNACTVAQRMITNLIKELNPGVKDIVVEVEYM